MELWELFESKKSEVVTEDVTVEVGDVVNYVHPYTDDLVGKHKIIALEENAAIVTTDKGYAITVDKDDLIWCEECNEWYTFDPTVSDDSEVLAEAAKLVWARRGDQVVKKYRCTSGRKQGRLVSKPSDCNTKVDLKKRFRMKKTLKMKGPRMRRKALRTKKRNPASIRVQRMNKARKL